MIPPQPNRWLIGVVSLYVRWIFRRAFFTLQFLNTPPHLAAGQPALLLANHTSWWDGFFAYLITRSAFPGEFSVLMREDELRKRRLFQKLGAFGVNPDSPASNRSLLRFLSETLGQKQRSHRIWIFPQGEITPDTFHPFHLKEGLSRLSCAADTPLLPLYIRVEYLNRRKPTVFVRFGEPLHFEEYQGAPQLLTERLEGARKAAQDALSQWGKR